MVASIPFTMTPFSAHLNREGGGPRAIRLSALVTWRAMPLAALVVSPSVVVCACLVFDLFEEAIQPVKIMTM